MSKCICCNQDVGNKAHYDLIDQMVVYNDIKTEKMSKREAIIFMYLYSRIGDDVSVRKLCSDTMTSHKSIHVYLSNLRTKIFDIGIRIFDCTYTRDEQESTVCMRAV